MKFSPRFEIISSPDKSSDRPAFFNIRNSNPNMNNYRVIQLGRHSIHFRFAGIGRRKNRSISPDSWQLTAMNGTLINRQRGWAMYPWLDCFDSNHSDTFPGRTNFLLPTSCPPARRRIPIAHWSPHPPSLPLFQLFTRVEIRRRGRAFRFESWQDFVNELWTIFHLIQENTISKTIHLFLLLNHLKRLHGSDLLANNSLARPSLFARFKIVSLTCARWYKSLCFILVSTPLEKPFRRPSSVYHHHHPPLPLFAKFAGQAQFLCHSSPAATCTIPTEFYFTFPALRAVCCLSAFAFPNSPLPALLRASLSAFVTATNTSFYFSSRTFFNARFSLEMGEGRGQRISVYIHIYVSLLLSDISFSEN